MKTNKTRQSAQYRPQCMLPTYQQYAGPQNLDEQQCSLLDPRNPGTPQESRSINAKASPPPPDSKSPWDLTKLALNVQEARKKQN